MTELAPETNALFMGLRDPAAVLELTPDGDDLLVLAANPPLAKAFGRTVDEFAGSPVSEVYPAAASAEVLDRARTTLAQRRTLSYEAVRELPTGRSVVRATMIPVGGRRLVGVGRDLSREREAVANLDALERTAKIGSWQWNIADDSMTWSAEYRRILGVDDQHPTSRTYLLTAVHPDDRELVRSRMESIIAGARPSAGTRFRIHRPDGEVRIVEGRGTLAHDPSGRPVRMSGTLQDITEQMEAQQLEQRIAETEVRQQQALEVNDDIVQGLTAAWLALQLGRADDAGQIVARTTRAAQELVSSLLRTRSGEQIHGGDLVRDTSSNRRGDAG